MREETGSARYNVLDVAGIGHSSMYWAANLELGKFPWLELVSDSQGIEELSAKFRKLKERTWLDLVSGLQNRD